MAEDRPGRRVFNIHTSPYQSYSREGRPQPEMNWLPISYDLGTGQGCYLMRMEPGAESITHDHPGMEEFLMLEGELVDDDGLVFRAGDFVSYEPGTRHNSRSKDGCLIAVFEWERPEASAAV